MRHVLGSILLRLLVLVSPLAAQAQDVTVATITREPFAMLQDGTPTGFSIELWEQLAAELELTTTYLHTDSFSDMLEAVKNGRADAAVANISITAAREADMDFSQPIFESGLQILTPYNDQGASVLSALFTWDIFWAIIIAIVMLFGGGMLMWVFERRASEYFNRPAKEAAFPAFWWALNLVVNGGFEERMPQSRAGRGFAVILVVASLFIVSIFVAKITAAMTIDALQDNVQSLSDLDGKRVATINGSTAALFMQDRDMAYVPVDTLDEMYTRFEAGELDAIVFDKPILAYYAATRGAGKGQLLPRVFKRENYGIALQTGSPLRERLDQSLLRLREDGTYSRLRVKWFGAAD